MSTHIHNHDIWVWHKYLWKIKSQNNRDKSNLPIQIICFVILSIMKELWICILSVTHLCVKPLLDFGLCTMWTRYNTHLIGYGLNTTIDRSWSTIYHCWLPLTIKWSGFHWVEVHPNKVHLIFEGCVIFEKEMVVNFCVFVHVLGNITIFNLKARDFNTICPNTKTFYLVEHFCSFHPSSTLTIKYQHEKEL